MLKCEININEKSVLMFVTASGDLTTICADLTMLLNRLYLDLKNNDPKLGEGFREMVTRIVTAPESPVWSEELNHAEN